MPTTQPITLYHAPRTRSSGALALLEELAAPYTLHVLNMKAGDRGCVAGALPALVRLLRGLLRAGDGGQGDAAHARQHRHGALR